MEKNNNGSVLLLNLLKKIAAENMSAVLIEGGAKIFTSFIKQKLVDSIEFMIAPKIIGSGIEAIQNLEISKINEGIKLTNLKINKLETDVIISGDICSQEL